VAGLDEKGETRMRVWKVLSAAAVVSALLNSTALAQEMGGAMGPGGNYGYTPDPAAIQDDRAYPDHGFGLSESTAGAFNSVEQSDSYCGMRHRSQEPRDGTYLGNDGRRHPC
jgi:hypothetical protein